MLGSNSRLRRRSDFGVTSRSSSGARISKDCSRESLVCGVSWMVPSEEWVRILVSCFSRQTLISKSSFLLDRPTIIPWYTGTPGGTNKIPLGSAAERA